MLVGISRQYVFSPYLLATEYRNPEITIRIFSVMKTHISCRPMAKDLFSRGF